MIVPTRASRFHFAEARPRLPREAWWRPNRLGIGRTDSRTPIKAVKMNRIEKLRGNIETLKDSLALDWSDLALPLADAQRIDIENHLAWCLTEMDWCLAEMKSRLGASGPQIRVRMPPPSRRSSLVVAVLDKRSKNLARWN
jgi:hypothetical protein